MAELGGFQVYRRQSRRRGAEQGPPMVNVAGDKLLISAAARALLGVDVDQVTVSSEGLPSRRIAIAAVAADTPDAQRYRLTPNGPGGSVSVAAFLRDRNVPAGKYPVEMEDGMLVAVVRS